MHAVFTILNRIKHEAKAHTLLVTEHTQRNMFHIHTLVHHTQVWFPSHLIGLVMWESEFLSIDHFRLKIPWEGNSALATMTVVIRLRRYTPGNNSTCWTEILRFFYTLFFRKFNMSQAFRLWSQEVLVTSIKGNTIWINKSKVRHLISDYRLILYN